MKFVKKSEVKKFENSKTCLVYEYDMPEKDINAAVAEFSGWYPDKGRVLNKACKELVNVIKGSEKIVVEDKENLFSEGDVFLINPGEKYYWDANATVFVPCTPAWYPEQHINVE